MIRRFKALLVTFLLLAGFGPGFAQDDPFNVAFFFPGDLGSNPIEPAITAGIERVNSEFPNVTTRLVEGGPASDWESSVIALAATGQYDLIVTFTDGLPQILETVTAMFPQQRFAILDSSAPGLQTVYSLVYSDEALGFMGGVVGGLLATHEDISKNSARPSIGLLAGTPYPAMDEKIHPGYSAGARYIDPNVEVLYAVVGDWNNPNRARDLALNMFGRDATTVMSVAGGGDSGAYRAAEESGAYAVAVNSNQNSMQPGVIVASVLKRLDNSIVDVVQRAMDGTLPYGSVETAGVAEGAISIAQDDLYAQHVPEEIRERVAQIEQGIIAGEIDYLELLQAELAN